MAEKPTGQGYYLGEQLRRFRRTQGLSLASVAEQVGFSEAKLSRIEGGRSRIAQVDMERLLDLYGIDDAAQRRHLLDFTLQQEIRRTGWWRERPGHHAGNVPQYVALEAVASSLRQVEPTLIPGLLQSPDYARVVLRARWDGLELNRETEARQARRHRLIAGELDAAFLIAETAVWLIPPDVRDGQVGRLIEIAELPNVRMKLIPRSETAYLTYGNPLTLLSFGDAGLPDVAYVEHWLGSFVVDDPVDVERAVARWEMIEKSCLTTRDTLEWLHGARIVDSGDGGSPGR
jgi:transcriptional regulator with XRE-family HTH domain